MSISEISFQALIRRTALFSGLFLLAACGEPEVARGINDPWEGSNRRTHEFNKGSDTGLISRAAEAYVTVTPEPVVTGIANFSDNLSTPQLVVNNLLQADLRGAFINSFRFVVNSTVGLGGFIDVATGAEIYEEDTDFGETLHVWGAREGAYLELPILGPSTERDAVGRVVDLFTNPLSYALPKPEKYASPVASVAKKLGDRGRYSQTVGSVLYDSADSYAQTRSTYLQNRRYQLSGGTGAADPYDDPYAAGDPYDDPYDQ
ncbi:VacJ family lipoprotein [Pseudooceanicola sp. MF1-13]|uniref:MlaA family lipoprotein n=1 Tax=Pseudooceanicola sp. MF1-13 TaxID=3379095 RepID=UPI003891DD45